jgi:hypothetical protein
MEGGTVALGRPMHRRSAWKGYHRKDRRGERRHLVAAPRTNSAVGRLAELRLTNYPISIDYWLCGQWMHQGLIGMGGTCHGII